MSVYSGKKILFGVTGSIAAFKSAGWVSTLAKENAQISVVMTEAATHFVGPLTFAALSGNTVYTDMFAAEDDAALAHITLGKEADLILVAPATAETIARLAQGMADDLLAATVLASQSPVVVCPAMNSNMYAHPAVQENIAKIKSYGYTVVEPAEGLMACKDEGRGRLPEWQHVDEVLQRLLSPNDFAGKTLLITAGPTRESIDPARFLSNRSSGKMGYALARAAWRRGAQVTLVSGPSSCVAPTGVEVVKVVSARQMYDAVLKNAQRADVVIKAAAVADFRAREVSRTKVKKEKIASTLELVGNPDILAELGKKKAVNQILVGFAAESNNLEAEGQRKLREKNLDLIAVNNINGENTGFEVDSNQLLLLSRHDQKWLPMTSKDEIADLLLDSILGLF